MIAYHTITPDSLQSALKEGLKRTSRGEKGDDTAIAETDKFLDAHRPKELSDANVSRDNNLYAYIADGDTIIDITDGKKRPVTEFIASEDQIVLQITINPELCYVSDIDLFDEVKEAVENNAAESILLGLAQHYWQHVCPLKDFTIDDIRRPEIMIPQDITPSDIKQLT